MSLPDIARELLFLPEEASSASKGIDALHAAVICATFAGTTAVGLFTGWFVIRYRRKTEGQLTVRTQTSTRTELCIAGSMLLLFCTFWLVGFRQYVDVQQPPANCMTVYVTAKQWMWKFAYADGRSANDTLTVPAGQPIKLVMVSRDVIHSFYVPAFRVKHDVLPGRYVTLWFQADAPGDYDILCAEYCGLSHSDMRGTVRVLSAPDYRRWQEDRSHDGSGLDDLVSRGESAAHKRACFACHSVDGQEMVGPTWAGLYGSTAVMTDGRKISVDGEYITRSMMEPNADIVAGYKPVMPTYLGVIDQPEVAAIVAYIESVQRGGVSPGVRLPAMNAVDAGEAP